MSWKDYFYFTKTERNGIWVLLILMVIVLLLPAIISLFQPKKIYDFTNFEKNIQKYERLQAEYLEAKNAMEQQAYMQNRQEQSLHLTPEVFNPNNLSEKEWTSMGIPQYIARNILNYLNAGGSFRFKEDLKRIYSLNDDMYYQLENFIDLPPRYSRQDDATLTQNNNTEPAHRSSFQAQKDPQESYREILIDINRSDTTEWQKIRGIGTVFSNRIVSYRDLLGGFYAKEQLLEVYGMDSSRYHDIKNHLHITDFEVKKIDINSADFTTLIRHPYLNGNQVNSLLRMRDLHGHYNTIEEIKKSELINDSLFDKIAPYITTGLLP